MGPEVPESRAPCRNPGYKADLFLGGLNWETVTAFLVALQKRYCEPILQARKLRHAQVKWGCGAAEALTWAAWFCTCGLKRPE